jgi:hypothetical protein
MVQYQAEYMVGGTKWVHREMIESTRELGSFMPEERRIFKYGTNLRKNV